MAKGLSKMFRLANQPGPLGLGTGSLDLVNRLLRRISMMSRKKPRMSCNSLPRKFGRRVEGHRDIGDGYSFGILVRVDEDADSGDEVLEHHADTNAADLSLGILGANGIVGGGFGIATGAALSAKMRNSDQVTVCFFGDGAANQGIFMEVANMAAVWKLPIIYVCENNLYAEYTRSGEVTARQLGGRATAFGLSTKMVDGNNVLDVYGVAREAVDHARAGYGPSFIEACTYRFSGHHVGDVISGEGDYYRTLGEIEERWKQEPVARFCDWLMEEKGFLKPELEQIGQQVEGEIEGAIAFATSSPEPDLSKLMEDIYA